MTFFALFCLTFFNKKDGVEDHVRHDQHGGRGILFCSDRAQRARVQRRPVVLGVHRGHDHCAHDCKVGGDKKGGRESECSCESVLSRFRPRFSRFETVETDV